MPIDPTSGAGAASANQTARTALANNFDTFLVLLTAQLQNQDPLSPLDSSEFTQQLVQFSQVEQQIQTNDNLQSILSQNQAAAAALPLGYLGHAAVIGTSRSALGEESPARWTYTFEEAPETVTLTVRDASGRVVHSTDGEAGKGPHAFSWDGEMTNGDDAPAGVYTLTVTARDSDGANVASTIHVIETVSGVDLSAPAPRVLTASGLHDLSEVLGVYDG